MNINKSILSQIDISSIIELAKEAGAIHIYYYKKKDIPFAIKPDNSEVSIADIESNALICNTLNKLYPQIPIISEEHDNSAIGGEIFWSIDPLDGTKSYLKSNGDFTVNIALIINYKPILGVVYAPLSNELYYTPGNNVAYKLLYGEIFSRKAPKDGLTVLIGNSTKAGKKLGSFLKSHKIKEVIKTSSALKFALIAEGKADIYPRFGDTMEWDTAAGHAILKAAGGSVTDLNGCELLYGNANRGYLNPNFIAKGI